jgi:hypothetical protein
MSSLVNPPLVPRILPIVAHEEIPMLTPAHQQFFHDNGYVVVEQLFSPAELA